MSWIQYVLKSVFVIQVQVKYITSLCITNILYFQIELLGYIIYLVLVAELQPG